MELSTYDIQARIGWARRQRSDALGELLSRGWSVLRQRVARFAVRRASTHFPWTQTPA